MLNATSAAKAVTVSGPWDGLMLAESPVREPQTAAANDEPIFDASDRKSLDKRRLARVVGPRLHRARLSAGYTQGEASTILGWGTPAQLSQAEQGRRLAPPGALIAAGRAYGVSLDYLYGESDELDRDKAAGHRAGVLRGVRHALDTVAQVVVEQIASHERLAGPGAIHVRDLIEASRQLVEAVATLMRANAEIFDEMRGSATVVRACQELTDSIVDAERRLRLHDVRDADLRAALSSMHGKDIPLPEDSE